MTLGLRRWQQEGHLHFITFSCAERKPYLIQREARDLFLESLEQARTKYSFNVFGYVVMPEHVHLLLSEPSDCPLPNALASIKLSVSEQSQQRRSGRSVITTSTSIHARKGWRSFGTSIAILLREDLSGTSWIGPGRVIASTLSIRLVLWASYAKELPWSA